MVESIVKRELKRGVNRGGECGVSVREKQGVKENDKYIINL